MREDRYKALPRPVFPEFLSSVHNASLEQLILFAMGRCKLPRSGGGMRRNRGPRRAALITLCALAAGIGGSAQAPPSPVPLAAGAPLEHAFAAGNRGVFEATLAAGGTYLVAVEQRGIHLTVDVRGPRGESVAAVDSPLDRWGVEAVLLRPATTGVYQVEVRAGNKGVGPGRGEIRLDEIPEDRERIAALEAMTRAGTILRREPTGSLDKVLAALQEARGHFQATGDRPGEAEAVAALADVNHRLGKQSQAVELYRDAVSRWRELQRPERELVAWNDLGLTLTRRRSISRRPWLKRVTSSLSAAASPAWIRRTRPARKLPGASSRAAARPLPAPGGEGGRARAAGGQRGRGIWVGVFCGVGVNEKKG